MTAEAEKTVTRPNSTSSSTTPKSHLSTPTLFAISLPFPLLVQLIDDLSKGPAAMFVVFELIEAGAGRSQQHNIAGNRGRPCFAHGCVDRSGSHHLHDSLKFALNLFRGRTNRINSRDAFAKERTEKRVVRILVLAAEDEVNAAGKGSD